MLLAFAEVALPAEAVVPRSRPCALVSVGAQTSPASKLLYSVFIWEQEMRLEAASGPSAAFLRHPDLAPGLRFLEVGARVGSGSWAFVQAK